MTNNYIQHVKQYMAENGLTNYKEGMQKAKETYIPKVKTLKKDVDVLDNNMNEPKIKKSYTLAFDDNDAEDTPIPIHQITPKLSKKSGKKKILISNDVIINVNDPSVTNEVKKKREKKLRR